MYAIGWAETVVKQHYLRHTRAAWFLLKHGGFTTNHLQLWLARRDPRWEVYKKAVLFIESFPLHLDVAENATQALSDLESFIVNSCPEGGNSFLRWLDIGTILKKSFRATRVAPRRGHEETRDLPGQLVLFPEVDLVCRVQESDTRD